MKKLKELFMTKAMKKGSYSLGSLLILAAILIAVNMIVSELPSKYTKIDISESKLYTIGAQTEEVVKRLEEDVTLYLLTEGGSDDSIVTELLERYSDLSNHIKVEVKDIVNNPTFASQYTDENVTSNSILVVGKKRSKLVPYSDLYITELDYTTYSSETTGFDGEGQITSAIGYVTTDELPILYTLTGHNETDINSTLQKAIEKENLEVQSLNLLTEERVPEDASCLLIMAPATDISEEEADKIISYLEEGRNAFIVSSYSAEKDMPNFDSVLEAYGLQRVDGVVMEGNSNNYYPGYQYYLIPEVNSHSITSTLINNNSYVIFPLAQGIETLESYRSTLMIESLISTSGAAYSKNDVENMATMEKESSDTAGPFDLAVAVTETYDDIETKLVFAACEGLLDESMDSAVSGGNTQFIVDILSWMCEHEVSVSIPEKSLSLEYLTVTAGSVNFWNAVCVILLPLMFVLLGGVIWFKRRKA